jgi:hypothetical protein
MDWLIDNPSPVYLILTAVALALLVTLWVSRKRAFAVALGIVALLALLFAVLTLVLDTDQKRIRRALDDMEAGVQARDVDRIFKHVTRDFMLQGTSREAFRALATRVLKTGEVEDVRIWDLEDWNVNRPESAARGTARVSFKAKPKGVWDNGLYYLVKAVFVLEDGEWRLQSFEVFDPIADSNTPLPMPK